MPLSFYYTSTTILIILFSFHCSLDPPDLHSFPTRRSSDLPLVREEVRRLPEAVILRLLMNQPHAVVECEVDLKSTRLNSSHITISYAVFCLKKKKKKKNNKETQKQQFQNNMKTTL